MGRKNETMEERHERWAREEAEQARLAARTMWEKINDCEDVHDLKEVLQEIVQELDESLSSRGGFPRPR